jgi:type IV pilus assembly protein PilX
MQSAAHERGMALISALLVLLVLTILAVGMFRSFGIQQKMAGNTRERQRALHASESAQSFAEWWLSSGAGINATAGVQCTGLVSANSAQVCSNLLTTVMASATNGVATVPWTIGGAEVGVTFIPPGLTVGTDGPNMYYLAPRFYISYLTGSYNTQTGTTTSSYQVDATGYGGSANAIAVVESTYVVSSTYTTQSQSSKSKFYNLGGP